MSVAEVHEAVKLTQERECQGRSKTDPLAHESNAAAEERALLADGVAAALRQKERRSESSRSNRNRRDERSAG